MKRKKLDSNASFDEQFQALRQLPSLSHAQCRQVIDLLHCDQKRTGVRSGQLPHQKYPVALPALRNITLEVQEQKLSIPFFSIADTVHKKVNRSVFFKECLADAMASHNDTLELVVAWDEAVPGNILAPDLRRKSALTYCTFKELPILWASTCWWTVSVSRTKDLQQLPQGYPRAIAALMQAINEETKNGFLVEIDGTPKLLHIKEINILADADGIKLLTGAKGFAGLKCCFRCCNVVSGGHTNLSRHEHISSRRIDTWQLHDRDSLISIQTYLLGVAGKTAREKAETQLGWNLKEMTVSVVVDPSLKDVLPLQNILYDPMHCWASNGLIGQEVGYWFAALCQKTTATLQQFKAYCKTCWTPGVGSHWIDTDLVLNTKLWPEGKDYRGEASACLDIMPLMVAFSHEVILPVFPCMAAEIESLTALNAVICCWQQTKRCNAAAGSRKLAECQQKHVQCFVSAYGQRAARPKLHFSLHLPSQFERKEQALDAFPMERKHKIFKSEVAPHRNPLQKFAQSCLLELGERDAKMTDPTSTFKTELVGNIQENNMLAKQCGCHSATVAQGLNHLAVKHCKGQFKIVSSNTAVEVLGACKLNDDHFLLCQELTKTKEIASGFTCWKKPIETHAFCLLHSKNISSCEAAVFTRVTCKDNENTVWLLHG